MENASSAKIINHALKYASVLWDEHVVLTLRLQENMRVKNEMNKLPNNTEYHKQLKDYEQWLLKIGKEDCLQLKQRNKPVQTWCH